MRDLVLVSPAFFALFFSLVLMHLPTMAQGVITTVAGTEWSFPPTPIAGMAAPLGIVTDMEFDDRGNLYLVDQSNHLVMKSSAVWRDYGDSRKWLCR